MIKTRRIKVITIFDKQLLKFKTSYPSLGNGEWTKTCFSISKMILCTGLSKIWFWLSQIDFTIQSLTLLTVPLLSGMTSSSIAMGHSFCLLSCFKRTTSVTWKFHYLSFHFCLKWSWHKNSFFCLVQNSFALCWTLLHLSLLKISALSKIPGGGKITFDFMVRMLASTVSAGLFTSLIVSTVNGCEFNITSHSIIKVCKDSISKLFTWLLSKPLSIALAERIYLSQIPPKWLTLGGFFQTIQSAPFESKHYLTLGFCSKHAFHHSFSAPTKLVPSSDQSVLMLPCLAMKHFKACINESASNECVTSMWTALLAI